MIASVVGSVYRSFLKPIFFQFDPESVHNGMVQVGALLGMSPVTRGLNRLLLGNAWPWQQPTGVTLAGISFPTRVGLAAGFDYNGNLANILPSLGFGFASVGTITLEAYEGNQTPRLGRYPRSQALLVNKGLKNLGAAAILKGLSHRDFALALGLSIASTNKKFSSTQEQINEILECFALCESSAVRHSYYELNISCPNTFGGEPFTTPTRLRGLLQALDAQVQASPNHRPIFIKMPIDLSWDETSVLLQVIAESTAVGVVFGNLTKDLKNPAVHPLDRKDWQKRSGNLSGRPTFDRSNRLIYKTRQEFASRFIIVGTGGIFSAADAKLKIALGADLVQLITGMIYQGPQLVGEVARALSHKVS